MMDIVLKFSEARDNKRRNNRKTAAIRSGQKLLNAWSCIGWGGWIGQREQEGFLWWVSWKISSKGGEWDEMGKGGQTPFILYWICIFKQTPSIFIFWPTSHFEVNHQLILSAVLIPTQPSSILTFYMTSHHSRSWFPTEPFLPSLSHII